jgi:hypothetical protein
MFSVILYMLRQTVGSRVPPLLFPSFFPSYCDISQALSYFASTIHLTKPKLAIYSNTHFIVSTITQKLKLFIVFRSLFTMHFRVFWDVTPCSHFGVDRCFRGTYCLHREGDNYFMKIYCSNGSVVRSVSRARWDTNQIKGIYYYYYYYNHRENKKNKVCVWTVNCEQL